jgi:hypothetical protein
MTVSFTQEQASAPFRTFDREAFRNAKFPVKKDYPFPTPSPAMVWDNNTKKYIQSDELKFKVKQWLVSQALIILNMDSAQPDRPLTMAELAEMTPRVEQIAIQLDALIMAQGQQYLVSRYDAREGSQRSRRDDLVWEDTFDWCLNAAVYAMDIWKPDFLSKLSIAGRKGGLISKRPPVCTVADLEPLAGMSKSAQAEALGCSTATIGRLRRELKAVSNKPLDGAK